MGRLRTLSGVDLLGILTRFGFELVSQRGSHVKLRRTVAQERRQTLTIPLHREMDRGTLQAIYRQALRFIPERELRPHFYNE